jgi:pimeloyl-ACP methyl ester carboxylesterase
VSQELIKIPLADGKLSYSLLNRADSDEFVIYLHGLASHTGRTLPFTIANHLNTHGFNVLRLGLYDERERARKVRECTLETHTHDLNTAVDFVRAEYKPKRIHVIGHSFGGLTILLGNPNVDSAILLDPSHPDINPFRKAQYVAELDAYLRSSCGLDYLIGPAMVEEYNALEDGGFTSGYHIPSLIITAEDSSLAKTGPLYARALADQTEIKQVTIAGAGHGFLEKMDEVTSRCLDWLKQSHDQS